MIARGLVWRLGLSQLLGWGVSYYLVAIFGEAIGRDTGWSGTLVYGGFSLALLTMGAASPFVGRAIDRRGGRPVMTAGSCVMSGGCLLLAAAGDVATYLAGWVVLGIAMRMALYDAAFASLVRIAGPAARRPISQITLLGGIASTVLWPIGAILAERLGWRGALVCYAGIALLTVPLHLAIPAERFGEGTAPPGGAPLQRPLADTPEKARLAAILFALATTLASIVNAAMSAHMIALLGGLGMATGLAVWASTLRGVGQSFARLCEIVSGSRLPPLTLGILATAIIPLAFAVGHLAGASVLAGFLFAFLYGAGFGLVTITRGTQPLALFDPARYGSITGGLLAPSFYLAALSPTAFAALIDRYGPGAAMQVATLLSLGVLAAALALWWRFGRGTA